MRDTSDMSCAHILTLVDSVDLPEWTPTLTYALVKVKVAGTENEYHRARLAEVNHGWTTGGGTERERVRFL